MAREESLRSVTLEAGADLSKKQYLVGALSSTGKVVLAGAGARSIGIIQNDPLSGEAATVGFSGISKVKAGAAIVAAGPVEADATGKVITRTTGIIVGDVLEVASAADQVISIMLRG